MSKQLVYNHRRVEPENTDINDLVGKMVLWQAAKSIFDTAVNLSNTRLEQP